MRGWICAPAAPISPFRSLVGISPSRAPRHNKTRAPVIRPLPGLTMCTSQKSPLFLQLIIWSTGTRGRARGAGEGPSITGVRSQERRPRVRPQVLMDLLVLRLSAGPHACLCASSLIPAGAESWFYRPGDGRWLRCFRGRSGRRVVVPDDTGVCPGGEGRDRCGALRDKSHMRGANAAAHQSGAGI